jgi:anti-sigma B factor antagonist
MRTVNIERTEQPRGLRLAGEIDLSNTDQLTEALEPEVSQGGDLTLDVSALEFIDSSGMRVLIRALIDLEDRGRLVLVRPREPLRRLIAVMGLERFGNLQVQPGEDQAG